MFDTNLENIRKEGQDYDLSKFFLNYINTVDGWKTKCKNLHWAAAKDNIHLKLDEFYPELHNFQDKVAEGYMGILGRMQPNAIKPIQSDVLNAFDFIAEVKSKTLEFYSSIPDEPIYKGISSECEAFIQIVNNYDYKFHQCDVLAY